MTRQDQPDDKISQILTELREQGEVLREQGTELRSQKDELRHQGVMIEHLTHQQQAILEIIASMNTNMQKLATKEELAEVSTDLKIVKAAVTDTNMDVRELQQRVGSLEATARA